MSENPHTTSDINITRSQNQIHILFLIRTSNSDCVTDFQSGSNKARVEFLGRVDII